MTRSPSPRRGRLALAAGAAQTVVAAVAGAVWLDAGGIAPGAVLFSSWAALALVLMIITGAADAIATLSSPSETPTGGRARPESDAENGRILKLGALLPLCQTAVGTAIVIPASLGGFSPTEYVLVGPGIGGAVGTFVAITGAAYLAMLLGVLLTLVAVVPALMLRRAAARRRAPKSGPNPSRLPTVALAVIVLALFPTAIAAVLAIATPSGSSRGVAFPLLLTVLGFDFSDRGYTVVHPGWLWTARIFGAVMVAAVVATLLERRSARLSAQAAAARAASRTNPPRSNRSARQGSSRRVDRRRRPRYRRRSRP